MIQVVTDRCQPWRYNRARCRLCIEACPVEGCLRFDDGAVTVDNEKCTDCGICTTVCPTSALVLRDLSDGELLDRLSRASDGGSLFLTCSICPDPEDAFPDEESTIVKLPCLALLKESHLIALILKDSAKDLTLDLRRCKECSISAATPVIEKVFFFARNLLSSLSPEGLDGRIKTMEHDDIEAGGRGGLFGGKKKEKEITPGPELSRRELFSYIRGRAREKAIERVLGVQAQNKGQRKVEGVPERRTILIEALKDYGVRAGSSLPEGKFPVHGLAVGGGCTMCLRCNVFCPTGALTRVDEEKESRVEFNAALCMNCYECKEFCPTGALEYEKEVDLKILSEGESRTLSAMERVECAKCKKPYIPALNIDGCPRCRKKELIDRRIQTIIFGSSGVSDEKTIH